MPRRRGGCSSTWSGGRSGDHPFDPPGSTPSDSISGNQLGAHTVRDPRPRRVHRPRGRASMVVQGRRSTGHGSSCARPGPEGVRGRLRCTADRSARHTRLTAGRTTIDRLLTNRRRRRARASRHRRPRRDSTRCGGTPVGPGRPAASTTSWRRERSSTGCSGHRWWSIRPCSSRCRRLLICDHRVVSKWSRERPSSRSRSRSPSQARTRPCRSGQPWPVVHRRSANGQTSSMAASTTECVWACFVERGTMAPEPYAAGGADIDKTSGSCRSCRFEPEQRTGPGACPDTARYRDVLARSADTLAGDHPMARRLAAMRKLADPPAARGRAVEVLGRLDERRP